MILSCRPSHFRGCSFMMSILEVYTLLERFQPGFLPLDTNYSQLDQPLISNLGSQVDISSLSHTILILNNNIILDYLGSKGLNPGTKYNLVYQLLIHRYYSQEYLCYKVLLNCFDLYNILMQPRCKFLLYFGL